jgi:hypothetical protein
VYSSPAKNALDAIFSDHDATKARRDVYPATSRRYDGLTAGISDLDTSLADMEGDDFTHNGRDRET